MIVFGFYIAVKLVLYFKPSLLSLESLHRNGLSYSRRYINFGHNKGRCLTNDYDRGRILTSITIGGLAYVHRMAELCINIDRLDKSLRELIDFDHLF